MNNCDHVLPIPNSDKFLTVGSVVYLSRFSTVRYVVQFGWYTWGGNRPVCGWYLQEEEDPSSVKPLQLPDLYDIYILEN